MLFNASVVRAERWIEITILFLSISIYQPSWFFIDLRHDAPEINAITANRCAVFWLDTPIYTTARGVVYQQRRKERTTEWHRRGTSYKLTKSSTKKRFANRFGCFWWRPSVSPCRTCRPRRETRATYGSTWDGSTKRLHVGLRSPNKHWLCRHFPYERRSKRSEEINNAVSYFIAKDIVAITAEELEKMGTICPVSLCPIHRTTPESTFINAHNHTQWTIWRNMTNDNHI